MTKHPYFFQEIARKIEASLETLDSYDMNDISGPDQDSVTKKLKEIKVLLSEKRSVSKTDVIFINKCYRSLRERTFSELALRTFTGYFLLKYIVPVLVLGVSMLIYRYSAWEGIENNIIASVLLTIFFFIAIFLYTLIVSEFFDDFLPKTHRIFGLFNRLSKQIPRESKS